MKVDFPELCFTTSFRSTSTVRLSTLRAAEGAVVAPGGEYFVLEKPAKANSSQPLALTLTLSTILTACPNENFLLSLEVRLSRVQRGSDVDVKDEEEDCREIILT